MCGRAVAHELASVDECSRPAGAPCSPPAVFDDVPLGRLRAAVLFGWSWRSELHPGRLEIGDHEVLSPRAERERAVARRRKLARSVLVVGCVSPEGEVKGDVIGERQHSSAALRADVHRPVSGLRDDLCQLARGRDQIGGGAACWAAPPLVLRGDGDRPEDL